MRRDRDPGVLAGAVARRARTKGALDAWLGAAALTALAVPAGAQDAPRAGWLALEVAPEFAPEARRPPCIARPELADAVEERLSRSLGTASARQTTLRVHVHVAALPEASGFAVAVETLDTASGLQGSRSLTVEGGCRELRSAVSLVVALLVDDAVDAQSAAPLGPTADEPDRAAPAPASPPPREPPTPARISLFANGGFGVGYAPGSAFSLATGVRIEQEHDLPHFLASEFELRALSTSASSGVPSTAFDGLSLRAWTGPAVEFSPIQLEFGFGLWFGFVRGTGTLDYADLVQSDVVSMLGWFMHAAARFRIAGAWSLVVGGELSEAFYPSTMRLSAPGNPDAGGGDPPWFDAGGDDGTTESVSAEFDLDRIGRGVFAGIALEL